jgi:carbonic anhydrase
MSSATEHELQERIGASSGQDASWQPFGVVSDQKEALREDLAKVHAHPLIPDRVKVGGFVYDVDTGLLEPLD